MTSHSSIYKKADSFQHPEIEFSWATYANDLKLLQKSGECQCKFLSTHRFFDKRIIEYENFRNAFRVVFGNLNFYYSYCKCGGSTDNFICEELTEILIEKNPIQYVTNMREITYNGMDAVKSFYDIIPYPRPGIKFVKKSEKYTLGYGQSDEIVDVKNCYRLWCPFSCLKLCLSQCRKYNPEFKYNFECVRVIIDRINGISSYPEHKDVLSSFYKEFPAIRDLKLDSLVYEVLGGATKSIKEILFNTMYEMILSLPRDVINIILEYT